MSEIDESLLARLEQVPLTAREEELLLAAMLGADELTTVIGGDPAPSRAEVRSDTDEAPSPPAGAFLSSVTVEGFRGISRSASLPLQPGPGLTVVCGRNGSGKSSFAEALEVLLTGRVRRLDKRTAVWQDAWRCLQGFGPKVSAELTMVGVPGTTTVTATWAATAKQVGDADIRVRRPGETPAGIDSLGWGAAMTLHRPFLSHSELETMLAEPSKLFDELNPLLGLEDLAQVTQRLVDARKAADQTAKLPAGRLPTLRQALADLDDGRAVEAAALLAGRTPDVARLAELATGATDEVDPANSILAQLRRLSAPTTQEVEEAASRLETSSARLLTVSTSEAGDADATAQLLHAAVDHYRRHGDGDCPVCGRPGALDGSWMEATEARVAELRSQASTIREARTELDSALAAARNLIQAVPPVLDTDADLGVGPGLLDGARIAWTTWSAADQADPGRLATHLRDHHGAVDTATRTLSAAAAEAHERRQDRWSPLAAELGRWCHEETEAVSARATVKTIKKIEAWLKDANDELRNQRLSPYADGSRAIWSELRQESNVDVVGMTLTGSGTRRAVDIAVTVDGDQPGSLGVLSQGEINALALSVFLPRACAPESPLRFVVIDDPVQAMDPSKVDGMARVLVAAADTRQVVVFTHDDRLPDALRNLDLPARIVQVVRQAGSVVDIRDVRNPTEQHLREARSLLAGDGVPENIAAQVVPNLCRTALEDACFAIVRRRRLSRGDTHQAVEDALLGTKKLMSRLALAIFDDAGKGGDVYPWLNRRINKRAADAVRAVNEGSHQPSVNFRNLVDDTTDLVGRLQAVLP